MNEQTLGVVLPTSHAGTDISVQAAVSLCAAQFQGESPSSPTVSFTLSYLPFLGSPLKMQPE